MQAFSAFINDSISESKADCYFFLVNANHHHHIEFERIYGKCRRAGPRQPFVKPNQFYFTIGGSQKSEPLLMEDYQSGSSKSRAVPNYSVINNEPGTGNISPYSRVDFRAWSFLFGYGGTIAARAGWDSHCTDQAWCPEGPNSPFGSGSSKKHPGGRVAHPVGKGSLEGISVPTWAGGFQKRAVAFRWHATFPRKV